MRSEAPGLAGVLVRFANPRAVDPLFFSCRSCRRGGWRGLAGVGLANPRRIYSADTTRVFCSGAGVGTDFPRSARARVEGGSSPVPRTCTRARAGRWRKSLPTPALRNESSVVARSSPVRGLVLPTPAAPDGERFSNGRRRLLLREPASAPVASRSRPPPSKTSSAPGALVRRAGPATLQSVISSVIHIAWRRCSKQPFA